MSETGLHLGHVVQAVLGSIHEDSFEEGLEKLRALFPDTTIVAALDLVDRDNVLKYKTQWGRCHYEVLGSTSTYSVFPRLGSPTNVSSYCTCPAFAFSVLMSESHLMNSSPDVSSVRLVTKISSCDSQHTFYSKNMLLRRYLEV
ncbi:hypothetical protein HYDPIDRAFT_189619 [Hydnomerulius pinastri MD-312]|uniref:Uncharacterized protein n=1 Tax=Hydnomerulius pinastri MD-312 TaxID=994086 RepID=A0A0C9WBM8_9AGAM|nr:hypothetical protein HYDPIDRAFT_189619 [Hydnomerulius pinastri MD-312]